MDAVEVYFDGDGLVAWRRGDTRAYLSVRSENKRAVDISAFGCRYAHARRICNVEIHYEKLRLCDS